ncbi:LysR family transcriptional regulator [Pseudaeromonas paramecii]|uniref:LysR family transcriptional regulator n=1 Tax=Pseudaeromonas paramecii TaxID=2138166 RepID=A0ABP8PX28_9GAMM
MLQLIADAGSFAAAARACNMVPSALTYRVRQLEEALDVLLFDRSTRQAKLTAAGAELLREGTRLLTEIDAIANRVKRVATGWESQFTIAVDSIIDRSAMMELCDAFLHLDPPTRLRLRTETLSGTLEALTSGQADLALGVVMDDNTKPGLLREPLGTLSFVFAVAPHHALACLPEPLTDAVIRQHRAVAIADSVRQGSTLSIGLLAGQDVFTVADMSSKLDAQIRGLGAGFLPSHLAQPYIDSGRLVAKTVERATQQIQPSYAWQRGSKLGQGKALQWWLTQLQTVKTRHALLGKDRHVISMPHTDISV